jgi:uncharacterized protein YlzI (FlbEa/FlbD family)
MFMRLHDLNGHIIGVNMDNVLTITVDTQRDTVLKMVDGKEVTVTERQENIMAELPMRTPRI